ncbi:MAG TPA: hypothetical protein VHO91_11485 [Rhodopila sp.]|nr:hypothetical protein [Rhodopila sp.]
MAGYLVVRAVVADPADRAPFDQWYRQEHLPDALKAFGARSAMRGWSTQDPGVHTAFYRFDSAEAAQAAATGTAIKALIAEFDRCWGTRVVRTRDILAIADELEESPHERS